MNIHYLKNSESLAYIAANYHIHECRTRYDHRVNVRLKEMQPNPSCLFLGDVCLPDPRPIRFKLTTDRSYSIKLTSPKHKLSLNRVDRDREPYAKKPFQSVFHGNVIGALAGGAFAGSGYTVGDR